MPVQYVIGDATEPQGSGIKIIAHCCNNVGAWGAGFTGALSNKWTFPEEVFLFQSRTESGRQLGSMWLAAIDDELYVANIIGQDGVIGRGNPKPIRYVALAKGLSHVADEVRFLRGVEADAAAELGRESREVTVHMPRLGSGLAGGDWNIISALIEEIFHDIQVFVYDLPTKG